MAKEDEMNIKQFAITVAAVASLGAAIGAGAAVTGNAPPWLESLNAQSEGLNQRYGLGDAAHRRALGGSGQNWVEALRARSEALNRYYGLGADGRTNAERKTAPAWLAALDARSEALNRQYGLGTYATKR
jgi:hypothetical protein